jgi:hypothetical protein
MRTHKPTQSPGILANGFVVSKSGSDPKVRRFLNAYIRLEECDRLVIDGKLAQIQDTFAGMGPLSAIELLMYLYDYRTAWTARRGREKKIRLVRKGHELEQRGWPEKDAIRKEKGNGRTTE